MKIAHLCLSLGTGGAEKLLVDNLPAYKEQGIDVSVIQLSSILEEPSYIQIMSERGIPVITLGNQGFRRLEYLFKLYRIIKEENYDIIHVHLFPNLYYIAFIRWLVNLKAKLVFTEHNVKNNRTTSAFFNAIEPIIYKKYDAIVAISPNVKRMLLKLLPSLTERIYLIENGVDVKKFGNTQAYGRISFLNEYNLDDSTCILMMTSRFSAPKDHSTLIKALKLLPANYVLFLIGEGPLLHDIKLLAQDVPDRVHFLGFRNDVAALMKTADLNILSTFHEGFSGVTLEGLAAGKPFLGADVGGVNDIIQCGDFLFEAGNADELAQKIQKIVEDSTIQKEMTKHAKEIVQRYDASAMVQKTLELYRKLLN